MLNGKTILVTGGLGFIGTNLVLELIKRMDYGRIMIMDPCTNMYAEVSDLYSIRTSDIMRAGSKKNDVMVEIMYYSVNDYRFISNFIKNRQIDIVVHLGAMTGVRDDNNNFGSYIDTNIIGFHNIIRACAGSKHVNNFIFASSSSIYGNTNIPISLYGATKKCDEILSYTYAYRYKLPVTGLRFFTVYGPYGRPDMFYFDAASKLVDNERVTFYRSGCMKRDYTYISDVVESIIRVMEEITKDEHIHWGMFDIGRGEPISNLYFIRTLAKTLAKLKMLPEDFDPDYKFILSTVQDERDPIDTKANPESFLKRFNYAPNVNVNNGLDYFAKWFKEYKERISKT